MAPVLTGVLPPPSPFSLVSPSSRDAPPLAPPLAPPQLYSTDTIASNNLQHGEKTLSLLQITTGASGRLRGGATPPSTSRPSHRDHSGDAATSSAAGGGVGGAGAAAAAAAGGAAAGAGGAGGGARAAAFGDRLYAQHTKVYSDRLNAPEDPYLMVCAVGAFDHAGTLLQPFSVSRFLPPSALYALAPLPSPHTPSHHNNATPIPLSTYPSPHTTLSLSTVPPHPSPRTPLHIPLSEGPYPHTPLRGPLSTYPSRFTPLRNSRSSQAGPPWARARARGLLGRSRRLQHRS